jgi:hypothetical protein
MVFAEFGSLASLARAQAETQIPWHRQAEASAKAAAFERAHPVAKAEGATALAVHVVHYALALDLDPALHHITGRTTIHARVDAGPLSSFFLDLDSPMLVDSVRAGGMPVPFTHTTDDLVVTLDRAYAGGETFTVDVWYGGVPNASSAFHFDSHAGQPLIWTLSEPYGARTWWPCQDTPADKADSVAIDVTVPSDLLEVSNGTLAGTQTAGGRTTYRWRERYPIVPYLVSVTAHPYTVQTTNYPMLAGGSVPLTLWSFADQAALATPFLSFTVQVLQRYASLFGEYPFAQEKYDLVQFPWGGGMEHQTATSLCCWSHFLVAHETAHQWFGDAVTCKSFQHIWLNEGFATYCEALWEEGQGGTAAYRANIWDNRFYGDGTILVPPDIYKFARIFDVNLSYNKPSWVLHMLRGVLGDATFFDVLRSYRADPRFAYGTATTEDFQAVAQAVSGRDLSNFFTRWIDTPYFPTYLYDFATAPEAGGFRVDLTLEQLQTQGLYRMPVGVRVATDLGSEDFVLQDSLATQTFSVHVAGEPQGVTIDPDRWILCTRERALLAPTFHRGVLLVNGVQWSVGGELTSAYAESVFCGQFPFTFWDGYDAPSGGYVSQLPAPLGHGALPPEVLGQFSTVIWVGDSDLDLWNDTSLVSFLRAGGNVLFLGRRGQEYLHPSRSSRLGLRWAETPNATLGGTTPAYPGMVAMQTTNSQSGCAVFETGFDPSGTALLWTDSQSFGVPRGVAAWRHPTGGGTRRAAGGHFAFASGRPYRWEHAALRANVRTILTQLFGEPLLASGTGGDAPPRVTRLHPAVPNPFNPNLTLHFDLAQPGTATLRVYTPAGRCVRTLVAGERQAGRHVTTWDGRDDGGRDVPSGVYLFRLRGGQTTSHLKATLVR